MYRDTLSYCSTCPVCQKTSYVRRSARTPVYPLAVISTPFRRIAMDIVGPRERSSASNQYILVICDYTTWYPEAFCLCTITIAKIISALVQLFSRIGIPDTIITDQGTNFTSHLMKHILTAWHQPHSDQPISHKDRQTGGKIQPNPYEHVTEFCQPRSYGMTSMLDIVSSNLDRRCSCC